MARAWSISAAERVFAASGKTLPSAPTMAALTVRNDL